MVYFFDAEWGEMKRNCCNLRKTRARQPNRRKMEKRMRAESISISGIDFIYKNGYTVLEQKNRRSTVWIMNCC